VLELLEVLEVLELLEPESHPPDEVELDPELPLELEPLSQPTPKSTRHKSTSMQTRIDDEPLRFFIISPSC
jgi:hypothetical protein